MTTKANHSTQLRSCPSPLVLFGIDSRGKPKAARFGREHATLAIRAATQLQLNVLATTDPKVAEIAARDDEDGRTSVIITRPTGPRDLHHPPHNVSRRLRIRDHSREKRGAHDCASGEVGGGAKRSSGNHCN